MSRITDWFWILWIFSMIAGYFESVRRLAAKDRRIEELERLLNEYRSKPAGIIDVDDVRQLLPGPDGEAASHEGVNLKIDV